MSRRQLRNLLPLLLAGLAGLAGLAACGPGAVVPRHPADVPGYHRTPPDLAGVDPSPLQGRRVLLDPGHGGAFRGAVGDGGLTEAEVNLGVALYLQGLLQWAGAEVHLTRTADVDLLTPADSSLTADLAARVALADSLQPDVFVSIHHNSTASRDPHVNETQTYYPLGREGADLDLARAIHRQLVRALEIEPARILPGGFHVLRHAPVPAVLGEPAMISNPVMEGRLTLARSLELEAAAYFLGLRDYFAAGTPVWQTDLPDTVTVGSTGDPLVWFFDPGHPAAPGLDPSTVDLAVDGRRLGGHLDASGRRLLILPADLAGASRLTLAARNLRGRATPLREHVLQATTAPPRWHWIADGVPDHRRGLAVPLAPADAAAGPRLLSEPPPQTRIVRHDALPDGSRWLALQAADPWPAGSVPGGRWQSRLAPPPGSRPYWRPGWPAIPVQPGQAIWLQAPGAHPLWRDAAGRDPWGDLAAVPDTLTWEPILPDLVGLRVAIDPQGGGSDDQGRGPYGTRGAELNLQVASRLAAMLQGLGCEVVLVRSGELWVPDSEKVRRADAHAADLYLALARGPRPQVRHHPGSALGTPWAAALARSLDAMLPDTVAAGPAWDYVLRHTACPAAVVTLETPASMAAEDRITAPGWQNAVARALLRGTVEVLAPQTAWVAVDTLLGALGTGALPAASLEVLQLDGQLTWLPPAGLATAPALASGGTGDPGLPTGAGRHLLELRSGPLWQLWALGRPEGGSWQARLLQERR